MTDTRKPLTRQRSLWTPQGDTPEALEILRAMAGIRKVGVWARQVHDGRLRAIVSEEPMGWHMSISHMYNMRRGKYGGDHAGRYPTWDEIADARYTLLPATLDFVMHLPPPAEYVAVHDTTFHLHEHPPR